MKNITNLTHIIIVLFLSLVLDSELQAQINRNYSNEFMNIGVSASDMSMSGAVVAKTCGVNSGYWNPAGLIHLESNSISLMHSNYFANIANFNYAALAMPIDDISAFGVSMIRFGVDDIMDTTNLIDQQGNINYDRINLFSAADYGFTVSYARKLKLLGFNYGVNAKVIRRIIGDFASSWGFGFDIGIQYETRNWKFGLMARDITTTFNSWKYDQDKLTDIQSAIPNQNQSEPDANEITIPKLQFGIAKKYVFNYDYSLIAEIDLIVRFEENNDIISSSFMSINPAFGFEFGYSDLVYFRGGFGNFQQETQFDDTSKITFQPNIGIGFKYNGIAIDYAITDISDQSIALYSNIFSIEIDLETFRK